MKRLAPGVDYTTRGFFRSYRLDASFNEPIVYVNENVQFHISKEMIEYYHDPKSVHRSFVTTIDNPGTLVLNIGDQEYDLIMRRTKRKVVQLRLPNKFNPHLFEDIDIVDICVKEFLTLIAEEAEEAIKTSKPPT